MKILSMEQEVAASSYEGRVLRVSADGKNGPGKYFITLVPAGSTQGKNRLEWADALESGDYKQTSGILARFRPTGDRFCCLGVVCDMGYFNGTWYTPTKVKEDAKTFEWEFRNKRGVFTGMPDVAQFTDKFGTAPGPFAFMNDDGATFKQIAAVIRASVY